MIQPNQYRILRRMLPHGEPVQKTTSGFGMQREHRSDHSLAVFFSRSFSQWLTVGKARCR
jgi:hypothetical protein